MSESDDESVSASESAAPSRASEVESTFRFFSRLPFFASTPLRVLRALAEVALTYETARDEVILQQGAPCDDGLFFVRAGEFRVVKELPVFARGDEAVQRLRLPRLTARGRDLQQQRAKRGRDRNQQPQQQQVDDDTRTTSDATAQYSSQASIQSTTTFLTSEAHRSAAQRERDLLRSGASTGAGSHTYTAAATSADAAIGAQPSFRSSMRESASMVSITEHESSADLAGYSELSAYADAPPPPPHADSSTASDRPPPVLVGSRFLEIGVLGPHSVFGEVGVMLRVPRTASVVSLSARGRLIAVTKFDFLRLNTRATLAAVRRSAHQYPTNDQLLYDLDDAREWERYKHQMIQQARDKTHSTQKIQRMPVVRRCTREEML